MKLISLLNSFINSFLAFFTNKAFADSTAGVPAVTGLQNPLSVNTIAEFVQKVLGIVTTIGIPIVAIFIIYSGFLFVKAQGKEAELEKAKDTLLYTIIGAAIVLGSWILAKAICQTVVELGSTTATCS